MPIENRGKGRDETGPAKKEISREEGIAGETAALRRGSIDLFLAAEDRHRLPERLQKKIERFAHLLIREGDRRCL